jgi:hypothetical protein
MAELLSVLPEDHPGRAAVLAQYRAHVAGLAAAQGGAGLWHQLLDRNDSYLETSASAMYVYAIARGSVDVVSTALLLLIVLLLWGYPRLQAAQVQRLVGWQGEYRATVSPAGITCRTDHGTLIQKWSVFQGYRETAGHFVLLSRDPSIMWLDVLPKRGVHEAGGIERLRAILDQYTPRV